MKFVKYVKDLILHLLVILFNKLFCFLAKQFALGECESCTCSHCMQDFENCSDCEYVSVCECAEVKVYE